MFNNTLISPGEPVFSSSVICKFKAIQFEIFVTIFIYDCGINKRILSLFINGRKRKDGGQVNRSPSYLH